MFTSEGRVEVLSAKVADSDTKKQMPLVKLIACDK